MRRATVVRPLSIGSTITSTPFDPAIPPKNIEEYTHWLRIVKKHEIEYHKTEYETMAPKLRDNFLESPLWKEISSQMSSIDGEYLMSTGYNLFIRTDPPKVIIKPWDSFLAKMFRWEILDQQGKFVGKDCNPDLWYEKANDIVRTLFEVKYLDGVEKTLSFIKTTCAKYNMKFWAEYKSNNDGYYAAHAYTRMKVTYTTKGGVRTSDVAIEMQITTQLQEVLRRLTHPVYANKRDLPHSASISDLPWQWRYREDEFFMNYLGHTLHNIEGIIMEVRRRRGGR